MNSVVTQRFVKCIEQLRAENRVRSSRQFALSLDYLPQSLSEIHKGRRDVTIELLRKAIELYKMNPVYLYTGEGPLFMTEEVQNDFRVLTIVTNSTDDERIVHVPVPAQAGYASEMGDPTFVKDLPTFSLPDYKYKSGTHRAFDVAGDSMEPTLFEGDKVVCSFIEPTLWETSIKDTYVYVIVTRGDIVVKRVSNFLKKEKQLELHADNGHYDSYRINAGEILEVWYVRAKISPFLPSPKNLQIGLHEDVRQLQKTVANQTRMIQSLSDTLARFIDTNEDMPEDEGPDLSLG